MVLTSDSSSDHFRETAKKKSFSIAAATKGRGEGVKGQATKKKYVFLWLTLRRQKIGLCLKILHFKLLLM